MPQKEIGTILKSIFAIVYFPFFQHVSLGSNAFSHVPESAAFQMLFLLSKG